MAAASSGLKQLHSEPVQHLYVTLRRSFAGTPKKYEAILKSLGFSYRQQTLCLPNSVSTRGQISKVTTYVSVETDEMRRLRLEKEAEATRLRPPIIVYHH